MMKLNYIFILVVLVGNSTFAGGDKGPFLGASVAASIFNDDLVDDHQISFKVFGGYDFNPYLAVELGYNNLGIYGEGHANEGPDSLLVQTESRSWTSAFLISTPPKEHFILFTRLGLAYHKDKLTFSSHSVRFQENQTNLDFTGGIGARYKLSEKLSLQGEWDRSKIGGRELDCLSLGFRYSL